MVFQVDCHIYDGMVSFGLVIVGPGGVGMWVHERQFKVVEGCPLEEGECVVDLVCVELKHVGLFVKVEL